MSCIPGIANHCTVPAAEKRASGRRARRGLRGGLLQLTARCEQSHKVQDTGLTFDRFGLREAGSKESLYYALEEIVLGGRVVGVADAGRGWEYKRTGREPVSRGCL